MADVTYQSGGPRSVPPNGPIFYQEESSAQSHTNGFVNLSSTADNFCDKFKQEMSPLVVECVPMEDVVVDLHGSGGEGQTNEIRFSEDNDKCTSTSKLSTVSVVVNIGQDSEMMIQKDGTVSPSLCVDLCSAKSANDSSLEVLDNYTGGIPNSQNSHHSNNTGLIHDSQNSNEINGETPYKRQRLSYTQEEHPMGSAISEHRISMSNSNVILSGAIEWVKRLVLNPGDPKKGQGPKGSKQSEEWVENCHNVLKKVRSTLWGRKEMVQYSGSTGKQRIPPSLYYKEPPKPNTRTLEKLRANQTRAIKCGLHLSGNLFDFQASSSPNQTTGSGMSGDNTSEYSSSYVKSLSEALAIGALLNNKSARKRIPVGSHFQASIPPWTGNLSNEMRKQLNDTCRNFSGTLVWTHQKTENIFDESRIGRGRVEYCGCATYMSVECVRKHIMEEREKMKQELGEAFIHWGFNEMGETVSGCWTKDEELIFECTVKQNPFSLGKNFWDELPGALPTKSFKELVSYYFNVFVVRRRAMENRMAPESIDSDDDEKEFFNEKSFVKDFVSRHSSLTLCQSVMMSTQPPSSVNQV